jgi:hypothetical protein
MGSHRSFHGCSARRDAEAGHRASHNVAEPRAGHHHGTGGLVSAHGAMRLAASSPS